MNICNHNPVSLGMEDIYYRVYDIFADIRDAIADVADNFIASATGIVDRALCRLGRWVLDANRFCARCQSHTCQNNDSCRPRWARAVEKIGQWLVGTNS